MVTLKLILWLIIACIFAVFSFYSITISRKYKNLKEEIAKPQRLMTMGGDMVVGTDYSNILNSLYDMVQTLSYIGLFGLILSTIAAFISSFI